MKYSIIFLIASFVLGLSTVTTAQSKGKDQFTVQVDGLGCPFCAYGLEKKFKELKGIKKVKIEMETGMLEFAYPAEKELSIEKVEQQVVAAGYTPVSVKIERSNGIVEATEAKKAKTITDGSNLIEVEFFVAGNCGMCKARIEKTANEFASVYEANWDKKNKMLTVKFDPAETTQADIEEAIAKAGHDTQTAQTAQATYDNLPACCHYERVE